MRRRSTPDDGSFQNDHEVIRAILRVVGPLLIVVGVGFIIVGAVSFFSAFGSMGEPKYFWCFFVGAPLLGLGHWITRFAFLGAVTRYVANEVTPVGTDVINTVASETRDSLREVASAVGQGFREGSSGTGTARSQICPECRERNDVDAKFCDECGTRLSGSRRCPDCGDENDPDARFCNECGASLVR